jgi:hypothetical protein
MAKDVGAMQVKGGYIVGRVDNGGRPIDGMDQVELSHFDQANLVPKMLRYLYEPLSLITNVIDYQGHAVVLICVMPSPTGCGFFRIDGEYRRSGSETASAVFRAGEVFWRSATRSVRITREGFEEIIERRLAARRSEWLEERARIELRLIEELRSAFEGRVRTEAPLGAVSFALPAPDIAPAALEMLRARDNIGLEHLLNDARARARAYVDADEIDEGLAELLDGVGCLAVASPNGAFDAGLRPDPTRSASLLPSLLAATRTGLTPAGDDELMSDQILNQHLQLWARARSGLTGWRDNGVMAKNLTVRLDDQLAADHRSHRASRGPQLIRSRNTSD